MVVVYCTWRERCDSVTHYTSECDSSQGSLPLSFYDEHCWHPYHCSQCQGERVETQSHWRVAAQTINQASYHVISTLHLLDKCGVTTDWTYHGSNPLPSLLLLPPCWLPLWVVMSELQGLFCRCRLPRFLSLLMTPALVNYISLSDHILNKSQIRSGNFSDRP